mmetsp:Transcript_39183/g.123524  ORF Transcript_39183/g.123524 Transcript_39183/m.123524 type:complete len:253 (+) Transcript_39183:592-1350(+)
MLHARDRIIASLQPLDPLLCFGRNGGLQSVVDPLLVAADQIVYVPLVLQPPLRFRLLHDVGCSRALLIKQGATRQHVGGRRSPPAGVERHVPACSLEHPLVHPLRRRDSVVPRRPIASGGAGVVDFLERPAPVSLVELRKPLPLCLPSVLPHLLQHERRDRGRSDDERAISIHVHCSLHFIREQVLEVDQLDVPVPIDVARLYDLPRLLLADLHPMSLEAIVDLLRVQNARLVVIERAEGAVEGVSDLQREL